MTQRRDDKLLRQIIERLRKIRKARGLTQDAVYEDTNVDIGKYEACLANLSITTIAILCKYYEIPLEEFFKGIDGSDDLI